MRLAHFIQRYPPALGGSEAYFARLSRYCAAHGDDVTVFTTNAISLDAFWSPRGVCTLAGTENDGGVTIHRAPLWTMRGRRWLLKPLSLVPNRLWQCLTLPCNPISWPMWRDAASLPSPSGSGVGGEGEGEGEGFDAVHASAFPYAFPIACARRMARRLQVPFIITPFLHLGNPSDAGDRTRRQYTSPALAWLLREADAVFAQTPSEREAALALGVAAENVVLQGLGVDPAECTGGDRFGARERWQLPPDAFVIGHLANHSREKGTVDLIEAMQLLWQRGQNVYLLLAGPHMPGFEAYRRALANHPRVRQLGAITDAEKRDFYAAIDVFALPSRSDSFGLVLLEAWANGIPNVAYRAGGVADVIRDGVDGFLAPCGDIGALTGALARLIDDSRLRKRFAHVGRERLPRDFRWADKLALVRETLAERSERAKKTRIRQIARTLPTLQPARGPE